MEVKKDRLIKKDSILLAKFADRLNVSVPTDIPFLEALDRIVNEYPYRSSLSLDPTKFSNNRGFNKSELTRIFKRRKLGTVLYKYGYTTISGRRKLAGLILKKGLSILYRNGNTRETVDEKDFFIFSFEANKFTFSGSEKRFKKFFSSYYRFDVFSDDRSVLTQDPKKLCDDLLLSNNAKDELGIYQIQINQNKNGKKLRVRIYSDSGELMEDFKKSLLDEKLIDEVGLKNILSIHFQKGKEWTILKISRINANQFLLRWKRKNQLSKELSNKFCISDSESVILSPTDEANLLSDLFRERRLLPYQRKRIYNSLLSNNGYADLIKLNRTFGPSLDFESVRKKLREVLKGEKISVEVGWIRKKCGLFFPTRKAKGAKRDKRLLVLKKKQKIVQHLLIDHEKIYNTGIRETLKQYFTFVPFLILDFRKNPSRGYEEQNNSDLVMSSGKFLSDLKNNPNGISDFLLNSSRTKIEDTQFIDIYFEVASELLNNLPKINRCLDSQQKGVLFEALCFCILSRILLTKKVGNSYQPDGKFILDDEKIIYDAKNLSPRSNNPLLTSVTHRGKIKDIRYIRKENVTNYVFIVNNVSDAQFNVVKTAIESQCNGCKVSAITLSAIRDIVRIYVQDPRKISINKLKAVLLSDSLKSLVTNSEIQIDESLIK